MIDLTLEQKIGQMMMVGWPSDNADDIVENIKRYNFGNIILFTRNITSASQIADVCGKIQEAAFAYNGRPCLIALDQEGGSVRRIYDGVTPVPGSMAIAAASEKIPDAACQIGFIIGQDLKHCGINVNLAPVVDVNNNPYNPIIAIRAYGDDPRSVSRLGAEFARGLQFAGVMPCYKHFIGHGDVDIDSHLELPRVKKTLAELEACELIPYMGELPDAVMTVHILYTALDDRFPTSISKRTLLGLLRQKLGFEGLVISDCFEMDALMRTFSLSEAAIFAVNASTDIVTVSHTFGRQISIRNTLLDAVRSGVIAESVIDAAMTRLMRYKDKYCFMPTMQSDNVKNREIATEISRAGTAIISGEPFPIDQNTVCIGVTNYVSSVAEDINIEKMDIATMIGEEFGIEYLSIDNKNFNLSETLDFVKERKVILCLTDSHLTLVQKVMCSALIQKKIEVMLISLRTPYDVLNQEQPKCHICTFEYTRQACISLMEVLRGGKAYGVCPVRLSEKYTPKVIAPKERSTYMMENVVKYIRDNYTKHLTLDSVAREFSITGTHLCKMIKKRLNRSFVDIVNEVRIGESKRLLTTTSMKIYEIASLCGFTDLEYFSYVFKKYNGVTPTCFRDNFNVND